MKKIPRAKGLCIKDKRSVFIAPTVKIGKGVTIYENNRIEGDTVIGDGAIILPFCYIKDAVIESGAVVESSNVSGAKIGKNCRIGPFARLREGAVIESGAKVGNFCEVKNAVVGKGTKINHLAYVGDAQIGENCNIGCGAIFVNYNGKIKQKSVVGDNCFIGSNCNVIAPVVIEDGAYICAGTTVTNDVKGGSFVIGRARQEEKEGRADKYLKKQEEK